MTFFIWLRILAILGGLAWTTYRLARRPDDWPLRAVVACLACFALSTPAQVVPPNARVLGMQPTLLAASEYSLIMCAAFFIMLFFAGRGQTPDQRQGALPRFVTAQAVLLGIAVVVTLMFGALAPPTVTLTNFSEPHAVTLYLISELYIGITLFFASRGARRVARSPETALTQQRGMHTAAAGLLLLTVSTFLLCGVQVVTLLGLGFRAGLGGLGGYGLLVGGPLFIAGICYSGVVMRMRSARLWVRRLSEYHQLRFLGRLMARTFPKQRLRRGWLRQLPLLGVHRGHRRRRTETRDALVQLSPEMPDHVLPRSDELDQHDPQVLRTHLAPLARWLVANTGQPRPSGDPPQGPVKSVLIPHSNDPDADVAILLALSRAIKDEFKHNRARRRPWYLSSERALPGSPPDLLSPERD